MEWEYKVVTLKLTCGEIPKTAVEENLNMEGRREWESYATAQDSSFLYLFFKRPLSSK